MRISDWSSDVCSSDLLADAWRQIRRVGLNINQAVHALHAATMKDSRLDLAREAARVAAMRDDVAEQTRAIGQALNGGLSYRRADADRGGSSAAAVGAGGRAHPCGRGGVLGGGG